MNADGIEIVLTEEMLVPERWTRGHPDSSHGASLVFIGTVRERNHGRKVIAVDYDAFSPLCQTVLGEICREARALYEENLKITIGHRLGRLEVGEVSVLIVVSSPHRAEAYAASSHVIENLKQRAPIWKKETYHDGETEWLQGHALCDHRRSPGKREAKPC